MHRPPSVSPAGQLLSISAEIPPAGDNLKILRPSPHSRIQHSRNKEAWASSTRDQSSRAPSRAFGTESRNCRSCGSYKESLGDVRQVSYGTHDGGCAILTLRLGPARGESDPSELRSSICWPTSSTPVEQSDRRDKWPDMERRRANQFGPPCVRKSAGPCVQEKAAREE